MVDHNDKRSETEEMNKKNPTTTSEESQSQANEIVKRCADCGTSKTPLWRGGPAGPKSLCNACGIRSRKKRRAILGLKTSDEKKSKKNSHSNNHHHRSNSTSTTSSSSSTTTTTTNNTKLGSPLHQRLIALGREVMMQRSTADNKQHRRSKLGEEEQAAVLLMALSYGSVYA